jgi:hypothetical protein
MLLRQGQRFGSSAGLCVSPECQGGERKAGDDADALEQREPVVFQPFKKGSHPRFITRMAP